MASLKILFLHLLLTLFQEAAPQSTGFSLKLIPWDSPRSPFYHPNLTQTQKIQMMVISSSARALSRHPGNGTLYTNDIQIPVKNQALRYSIKMRIGSPGTEVTLLLDTGTARFGHNASNQNTISIPRNQEHIEHCPASTLQSYGFKGGKIQHIYAVLSSDSFTLPVKNKGSRTFSNMIFGCSSRSPVFSGILGLDKLPVSLISQVRNEVQGRYSYCLHDGDGYLRFGNDIPQVGKDAKTTRILYPYHPTLFLDLKDISVDQKRLGLSPVLFSYEQGGFLIDTGAQLSVIKKQAYDKVIQAFANYYTGRLKRVNGRAYHLDLCYRHNSSLKSYASMTFHLEGADYVTKSLYIVPQPGILCLGLIPGDVPILGALQQWNTRFVFDIITNTLKFVNEDCSKDRG
ncbi:Aspartic proteinase CDR1 [Sesamum alatum]|uniref:Aspartic proteinase CDR1 n=1 Tax=Sesamum alatum TaxID=300844 RepID=A0AAE1XZE0_9LAMI|nr:Aspartic proteinase CDR1 [Sesamum alatum]